MWSKIRLLFGTVLVLIVLSLIYVKKPDIVPIEGNEIEAKGVFVDGVVRVTVEGDSTAKALPATKVVKFDDEVFNEVQSTLDALMVEYDRAEDRPSQQAVIARVGSVKEIYKQQVLAKYLAEGQ